MQSYRYLLIVDEPDGRLAALGQQLRERGYRAVCVPSARDALDFAKAFPKLFLCFVNESQLGKSGQHFLEDVDTMREGLPIAWVHGGKPPVFLERRPELIFGPEVSADEFVKNVTRTLGGERYPRELLDEFAVCATVALSSLAAHTVSGDAFVRESWTPLSELNALIPFSGPAAHGQMIAGRECCALPFEFQLHLTDDTFDHPGRATELGLVFVGAARRENQESAAYKYERHYPAQFL